MMCLWVDHIHMHVGMVWH